MEPKNRLVARGLETEWENRLRDLTAAENELRQRKEHRTRILTPEQTQRVRALGADLRQVWAAPTTTIAIAKNYCGLFWRKSCARSKWPAGMWVPLARCRLQLGLGATKPTPVFPSVASAIASWYEGETNGVNSAN